MESLGQTPRLFILQPFSQFMCRNMSVTQPCSSGGLSCFSVVIDRSEIQVIKSNSMLYVKVCVWLINTPTTWRFTKCECKKQLTMASVMAYTMKLKCVKFNSIQIPWEKLLLWQAQAEDVLVAVLCVLPLSALLVQINRERPKCLHTELQHYKAWLSVIPEVKRKDVDLKSPMLFIWLLLFLIMKLHKKATTKTKRIPLRQINILFVFTVPVMKVWSVLKQACSIQSHTNLLCSSNPDDWVWLDNNTITKKIIKKTVTH